MAGGPKRTGCLWWDVGSVAGDTESGVESTSVTKNCVETVDSLDQGRE